NDGKMFQPFAIRRTDEMLYVPEADFDIESFRERIESPRKQRQTYAPQIITEMAWPRPELDKPQLASAIMEETGCSKATAYRLIDAAATQRIVRFNKQTKIYAKK